jgi:hypothetical protein
MKSATANFILRRVIERGPGSAWAKEEQARRVDQRAPRLPLPTRRCARQIECNRVLACTFAGGFATRMRVGVL